MVPGGVTATVFGPDGTYWYLAHLSAIAPDLADGQDVTTGQVLGFVGASRNAAGSPPHVHVQLHPRGGPPVDPKPVFDRLISDATAMAPDLIDAYRRARDAHPPSAPRRQLAQRSLHEQPLALWTASVSPVAGGYQLAVDILERAAAGID